MHSQLYRDMCRLNRMREKHQWAMVLWMKYMIILMAVRAQMTPQMISINRSNEWIIWRDGDEDDVSAMIRQLKISPGAIATGSGVEGSG